MAVQGNRVLDEKENPEILYFSQVEPMKTGHPSLKLRHLQEAIDVDCALGHMLDSLPP